MEALTRSFGISFVGSGYENFLASCQLDRPGICHSFHPIELRWYSLSVNALSDRTIPTFLDFRSKVLAYPNVFLMLSARAFPVPIRFDGVSCLGQSTSFRLLDGPGCSHISNSKSLPFACTRSARVATWRSRILFSCVSNKVL